MTRYRIDNRAIARDAPEFEGFLAALYEAKRRPLCLCRGEPGIPMYISKFGDHYIDKRMPETGAHHDPTCDSYEPPPELSGLGQVSGSAIHESPEEGFTDLRLAFSLTKIPGRGPSIPTGVAHDSVRTDGSKLTLRATLHHLWDRAGFTRWSPAMVGKRNWHILRKFLLLTAQQQRAKGDPLSTHLFVPEVFSAEHKEAIEQRRRSTMNTIATHPKGARRLMLLIAEVKEIKQARYGHKIVARHLPDFPFTIADDLHERLTKRFADELALWDANDRAHLLIIGTFGIGPTGIATLEEVALLITNDRWIPYEHVYDKTLLDALIHADRRFLKGLRYNLPSTKPLATVILSDTKPAATALYVIAPGSPEGYAAEVQALAAESELASWIWDAAAGSPMPPLPPPAGARRAPTEVHPSKTQHPRPSA
jgi:hypothetical protein